MYEVINPKSMEKNITALTYTDYFNRLSLIAKSVFKWNGLPNNMSEKWIEKFLFSNGSCVFFEDAEKGFMVSTYTTDDTLNNYDEPTAITPTVKNEVIEQKELTNRKDCVIIANNDDMLPTVNTINLYALRLTNLTRTSDINIDAQRTPVLITGSDKSMLSLKTTYDQWKGYRPVIFQDKNFIDGNSLKVLKTDAPIVFDKLRAEKHQVWNECMTFLGVNNANMDKKERLVDDEVQANNEQIQISADVMLKARQEACETINRIFNTNITVERRKLNTGDSETNKRGGTDGEIHSND